MERFVLLRWTPIDRESEREGRAIAARLGEEWATLADWRGVLLLSLGAEASEIPRGAGFVFGEVFNRDGAAVARDELGHSLEIWAKDYWGAFIAILIDRGYDLIQVLRDASGARRCFRTRLGRVHVVFSDARDIVRIAPDLAPDLEFITSFIRYPRLAIRRTGLVGVSEMAPGEAATFSRTDVSTTQFWSPSTFHGRDGDFGRHASHVRGAGELVMEAWGRGRRRLAHRLSGGLDSAIVLGLAAHKAGDVELVCVNEFWAQAIETDERVYARLAAARSGRRLIELNMDPSRVRYEHALAAPLTAKPSLGALSFADRSVADFYRELDVDGVLSGQGGDHIFHRSRTPLIAADAFIDGLPRERLLRVAVDTARLCGRSVWDVGAAAARAALMRPKPGPAYAGDALDVLNGEIEQAALSDHSWLQALNRTAPARAARIWHLLDALNYHDPSVIAAPTIPILLSQPLIEACLAVPPYVMTEGGRERALARTAFADLIPTDIAARTLKGETTRYFAAILASNREWIVGALTEGELVRLGVVDEVRLRRALRQDWRQSGMAAGALYPLLASEIWLRALKQAKADAARTIQSDAP